MLKDTKIGVKLTGGFVAVALLCAVVGTVGLASLQRVVSAGSEVSENRVPSLVAIGAMHGGLSNIRRIELLMLAAKLSANDSLFRIASEDARKAVEAFEAARAKYEPRSRTADEDSVWKIFRGHYATYETYHQGLLGLFKANDIASALPMALAEGREKFDEANAPMERLVSIQERESDALAERGASTASTARFVLVAIMIAAVLAAIVFGTLLTRSIVRPLQVVGERVESLRNICMEGLRRALNSVAQGDLSVVVTPATKQIEAGRKDEIGQLCDSVDGVIRRAQESIEGYDGMVTAMRAVVQENQALAEAARHGKLDARGEAQRFQGTYREMIAGLNATLDAIVAPINEATGVLERLAARDLSGRVLGDYAGGHAKIKVALNSAIENLDAALSEVAVASEQVASASDQITAGSTTLARASSDQASALEEISSSLQEMSSMVKQSAGNAAEARGLADEARQGTGRGVESMRRLSIAVERIKQSSDSTAKIVKTIDEIAFQTNLLALNAAVEAARAGDAGRGFAVVAEEVRSLAMRSAEAARTTADLIEESVRNAESGVEINTEVVRALDEINGRIAKVSDVMSEIAAATEQQTHGIAQINGAVDQMNSLTQQTAANAEESASAATEMSSQAESMKDMVGGFVLGGARQRRSSPRRGGQSQAARPASPPRQPASQPRAMATAGSRRSAAEVIPFDEDADGGALQEF